MKYVTVIALMLIFSVLALISGPIALLAVAFGLLLYLLGNPAADVLFTYASNIAKTLDRTGAALFGWNGNKTISWECGRSDCLFCKVICSILNVILEPDHCKKEADRGI